MKNKEFSTLFGNTLRTKRKNLQLTQEKAAEILKISTRWYQKIEYGISNPRPELAFAMVKLFNINISVLVSEDYTHDYSKSTN